MRKHKVAVWSDLSDRVPTHALVGNVDLVLVRWDDQLSVLYGRCLHRGALLADGSVVGEDIVCGVHGWDFRVDTGVSTYNRQEVLHKFSSWIDEGAAWVDADEIAEWEKDNPQAYDRSAYQGAFGAAMETGLNRVASGRPRRRSIEKNGPCDYRPTYDSSGGAREQGERLW